MNTYEAKKLLLQSLRCLAMSMEQIRQRETEKVMGDDEPMQDHLAECTSARTPYEGWSVDDCCLYLKRLYEGFDLASKHEILMERKFDYPDYDVAHICDMVMGFIGHGFPDGLVACAREINDVAKRLLKAKTHFMKGDRFCEQVVTDFLTQAETIMEKHGFKDWKDGEYSLSMGYLASWMQRMCQEKELK